MINRKYGIVIIILALITLVVFGGFHLSTYRPGWEISTELIAFQCDNPSAPLEGFEPESPYIETFSPTANIQWDQDFPEYGLPDVKATVSDVREEFKKMPYETLEQHYEGYTYVIDYHEYLFDVQIRTIADVEPGERTNGIIGSQSWRHETGMPYQSINNAMETWGEKIGKSFEGGVYARFSCLPWGIPDYGELGENYVFKGYWLGVMNAKVESHSCGIATPDIEVDHKGWVRNVESVGSQLNMYKDDGELVTAYNAISWDATKILDPDIQNVVIVYLPFNIMAGASTLYDALGGIPPLVGEISDCKPVDYYLTYTVRMESLVVKEYEFRDPGLPPRPSPIDPPVDYVQIRGAGFWEKYLLWIIIALIIAVLLFIGLVMLGGVGIYSMGRGCFRI